MKGQSAACAVWALAVLSCAPHLALAHGTAERYDLPLPLGYYVIASALAVALSFVVSAVFIYAGPRQASASAEAEEPIGGLRIPASASLALRGLGLAVLTLVIIGGLLGNQHPAKNIVPTLTWVAWWVGLSLLVAIVGDLWALINPWSTLALAQERLASPLLCASVRRDWSHLGQWPAVAALMVFVGFELVSPWGSSPLAIALLAIAYTLWTLLGARMLGAQSWLRQGEVFGIVFALMSRLAPVKISTTGDTALHSDDRPRIWLRWPGTALLESAASNSIVSLLLLLLSAVLFDGLLGTAFWRAAERALATDREGYLAATIGLIATWLAFLGIYLAACRIMRAIPGDSAPTAELYRRYALTLVPIALGYNIAHNFAYLLVQGQSLTALASDPLGRGWNLFGTATMEADIGIVGARTTWYVAMAAIVGGHIVSVVLAHIVAVRSESSQRRALIRLIPLTVVMILYTAVSLSIIADPLVRFRAPDPGYS